ncbi:MAG: metallophosphoesterase family protein, partial [Thermoleophilia bacterium]|nr:metallophosphoesterase family protein [Thermoleophilia bacterium]
MRRPALAALLAALALAVPRTTNAHDGHEHPPKPVPEPEAHRPSAIPDRIIRTFAADPARSIAVNWRTSADVARGIAQIAPADAGPKFASAAKTVDARSTALTTDLGEAKYHSVVFDDLAPSRIYAYRVGDGVNWSEWVHARTASDRPERFSFIYFGDAQNDVKSMWSRVIRGAYSDAPKAAFIVHAGDLINRANRDAEWGEWFGAGGWVNAMVPSVPSPGNHEYERPPAPKAADADAAAQAANGATRGPAPQDAPAAAATQPKAVLSRHWRPQFTLPEHGPSGLEESVYYVDYQGTRVISLNSNEGQEAQVPWLEGVLKDNPNRWTVVTFHHPIYSAAKVRDNPKLRDLWQPLFDRYKVDLVLQGHDHTYARSGLRAYENIPTGLKRRDDGGGTVYVVSVSGPKMYDNARAPWMVRSGEDTQLYQIITIDGGRLSYEARTAVGDLYDAFDLVKSEGAANVLVDRVPPTPERHRPPAPA